MTPAYSSYAGIISEGWRVSGWEQEKKNDDRDAAARKNK